MGINIKKASKEIKENIINDYKKGKSLRQLEKEYNITRQSIANFLEKENLKTQKGNHYRKYYHNENFFETIDTEEKAYWLGAMFSDGYIIDNSQKYGQDCCGIAVAIQDKGWIEKFKKSLSATNPVVICRRTKVKGQDMVRVVLTSQKTVDDLISHGCGKQKSLILQPPKGVPNNLLPHFIRGLFDGDGSLTKTHHDKYYLATNGYVYGINITTTEEIANWLKDYFGMGQVRKDKRKEKTFYYVLGGHKQVEKFYHILYDNATIWMDRKYNRFQELISKIQ